MGRVSACAQRRQPRHARAYSCAVARYKQAVDEALRQEALAPYGELYLGKLLESWRETAGQLRRTTVLIIAVGTAFVLITSGDIEEFTLGSLKFADIGPVVKLAPIVIAYHYLQLVLLFFSAYEYNELYDDVCAKLIPEVHRVNMDVPLAPTLGGLWGGRSILTTAATATLDPTLSSAETGWSRPAAVLDHLNSLGGFAFLLLPLVFLVWSYWRIFDEFGFADLVTWLSVAVTVMSISRAVAVMLYWRAIVQEAGHRSRRGVAQKLERPAAPGD
jgi:hypothetical protein